MELRQHSENEDQPQVRVQSAPVEIGVAGNANTIREIATTSGVDTVAAQRELADEAFARAVLLRLDPRGNGLTLAPEGAMPILALALVGCLLSGQPIWAGFCLCAIGAAFALRNQADLSAVIRASEWDYHLDRNALPILCRALECPARRVRPVAAQILTRHLVNVRPEDAELLDKEARNCLYRSLTPRAARSEPDLAIAILNALPLIGTDAALSYVNRLATGPGFIPTRRRIRLAARKVHDGLADRVKQQRDAELALAAARPLETSERNIEMHSRKIEAQAVMPVHLEEQLRDFETERRKVSEPGMRPGYLALSWLIIVPYTAFQAWQCLWSGQWPAGALFGALSLLATQLYRFTLTDKHLSLARRLAKIDDVHCIGRLAELLDWPDEEVRKVAVIGLMRLLPRVKASDEILITTAQRASLNRMLVISNAAEYVRLLVRILEALAQIGDASSVPFVERLANERPVTERERMVRNAATDCLPYLLTRAEINQTSQSLLRASSAVVAGPDALLRPAHPTETAEDQLLRATPGGK